MQTLLLQGKRDELKAIRQATETAGLIVQSLLNAHPEIKAALGYLEQLKQEENQVENALRQEMLALAQEAGIEAVKGIEGLSIRIAAKPELVYDVDKVTEWARVNQPNLLELDVDMFANVWATGVLGRGGQLPFVVEERQKLTPTIAKQLK